MKKEVLQGGIAGSSDNSIYNHLKDLQCFPKQLNKDFHQQRWESQCLHFSPNTSYCQAFHASHVCWIVSFSIDLWLCGKDINGRRTAARAQSPAPSRHVICPCVRLFRLHKTRWRMKVKKASSGWKGGGLLRDAWIYIRNNESAQEMAQLTKYKLPKPEELSLELCHHVKSWEEG